MSDFGAVQTTSICSRTPRYWRANYEKASSRYLVSRLRRGALQGSIFNLGNMFLQITQIQHTKFAEADRMVRVKYHSAEVNNSSLEIVIVKIMTII